MAYVPNSPTVTLSGTVPLHVIFTCVVGALSRPRHLCAAVMKGTSSRRSSDMYRGNLVTTAHLSVLSAFISSRGKEEVLRASYASCVLGLNTQLPLFSSLVVMWSEPSCLFTPVTTL